MVRSGPTWATCVCLRRAPEATRYYQLLDHIPHCSVTLTVMEILTTV